MFFITTYELDGQTKFAYSTDGHKTEHEVVAVAKSAVRRLGGKHIETRWTLSRNVRHLPRLVSPLEDLTEALVAELNEIPGYAGVTAAEFQQDYQAYIAILAEFRPSDKSGED